MANRNPSPKTRFRRGQVANPRGAGAHNPELRRIRQLTSQEIADVGSLILENSVSSLQELAKSKTASSLQVMLANIAMRAIRHGDARSLDFLLDRIVGRVANKTETIPFNKYEHMSIEELLAEKERLQIENAKTLASIHKQGLEP